MGRRKPRRGRSVVGTIIHDPAARTDPHEEEGPEDGVKAAHANSLGNVA
jgi:hypothetical protein